MILHSKIISSYLDSNNIKTWNNLMEKNYNKKDKKLESAIGLAKKIIDGNSSIDEELAEIEQNLQKKTNSYQQRKRSISSSSEDDTNNINTTKTKPNNKKPLALKNILFKEDKTPITISTKTEYKSSNINKTKPSENIEYIELNMDEIKSELFDVYNEVYNNKIVNSKNILEGLYALVNKLSNEKVFSIITNSSIPAVLEVIYNALDCRKRYHYDIEKYIIDINVTLTDVLKSNYLYKDIKNVKEELNLYVKSRHNLKSIDSVSKVKDEYDMDVLIYRVIKKISKKIFKHYNLPKPECEKIAIIIEKIIKKNYSQLENYKFYLLKLLVLIESKRLIFENYKTNDNYDIEIFETNLLKLLSN